MDDPGPEDPAAIADQIAQGAAAKADFVIDLDRRSAIRRVFEAAQPGDVVLLAGKGHEQRMVVRDQRLPWNDTQAAYAELARLGWQIQPVL
jgi:UDP-N-acetylmuramoyl-L-alanyl-D-glutamate--2,6-diaminopimelate ligase